MRRFLRTVFAEPAIWAWPVAVVLTGIGIREHLAVPLHGTAIVLKYYLPSTLLVAVGCIPSFLEGLRQPRLQRESVLPRRALVVLTALVLGAAIAIRLIGLDVWPPPRGSSFEEAQLGQQAKVVLDYRQAPGEHVLAILSPALSFVLFGTSMTTLRLPFILLGALTPWFVYLVCRRVAAREVALFATALFAVSWWSVTSSRVADEIFFPAALVPLVLLALINFTESARPSAAFGLALLSGLLLYEYTGYHIAVVLLLGYFAAALLCRAIVWLWRTPRPPAGRALALAIRRWMPGLIVIAIVWTNVATRQVVGDVMLDHRYLIEGFARHQRADCGLSSVPPAELAGYAENRFAAVYQQLFAPHGGDDVPVTGFVGHPLFDAATTWTLAIAALLVALTFWRPYHAFVWAWIAAAVSVAALFPCNSNAHRHYTVLPLAYVLIALGAQTLWSWLRPRGARLALCAVFGAIVAAAAYVNLTHLWTNFLRGDGTLTFFDEPSTRVSLWLAEREPDSFTWIVAEEYEHLGDQNDYYWLLNGRHVATGDSISAALPATDMPAGPLYYLFISRPGQPGIGDLVRRYYPHAERLDASPLRLPDASVDAFRIDRGSDPQGWRNAPLPIAGFRATYATSRSTGDAQTRELPADARLLLERDEALLSELAVPLSLKKRYVDESQRGNYLWADWRGEIDSPSAESALFRLTMRGGEAWLSVNDGPATYLAGERSEERSGELRAELQAGRNAVRVLQRFGPGAMIGAQLTRVMADGSETLVTAPAASPRVLSLAGIDPIGSISAGKPAHEERIAPGYAGDDAPYFGGYVARAPAELRFRLPPGAREFQSMARLHEGFRGCSEAALSFAVFDENGARLAQSEPIDAAHPQTSLRADVRGRQEIVLHLDGVTPPYRCDVGIWGNPVVLIDP